MPAGQRPTASYRVNRGGSYANDASNLASAYRDNNSPDNRNNNLGFRLALAQSRTVDAVEIDPAAAQPRLHARAKTLRMPLGAGSLDSASKAPSVRLKTS